MNPFKDPMLTLQLVAPATRFTVDGIEALTSAAGNAFGDEFSRGTSSRRSNIPVDLADRRAWLAGAIEGPDGLFLGGQSRQSSLSCSRLGGLSMQRIPAMEVTIRTLYVEYFIERAEECLALAGMAISAFRGTARTHPESRALADQWSPNPREVKQAPFGLPKLIPESQLASPYLPPELAWLNYWSKEACRELSFVDLTRDGALLTRSRELPNGAWLVRLTDEPLDPASRPDHVRALIEAYARFPQIGGRDVPHSSLRG